MTTYHRLVQISSVASQSCKWVKHAFLVSEASLVKVGVAVLVGRLYSLVENFYGVTVKDLDRALFPFHKAINTRVLWTPIPITLADTGPTWFLLLNTTAALSAVFNVTGILLRHISWSIQENPSGREPRVGPAYDHHTFDFVFGDKVDNFRVVMSP